MKWITRKAQKGFTLIELMIVVAIIGILAVLAIYGVSRYLRTSKTAEATNNVGQVGKNAAEAYTREKMSGAFLAPGASVAGTQSLCLTAAAKVPSGAASIKGAKYQSAPSEWTAGDATTGWKCLKYEMIGPQYFMYGYSATTTAFTATAEGDLDGNGTTSAFVMAGSVVSATVLLAPKPDEFSPEE